MHKDNEREIKSIVQPNSVFVLDGYVKFRIGNVLKTLDSAVLVATLTSDKFKPYLVLVNRGSILFSGAQSTVDIVFVIQYLGVTLFASTNQGINPCHYQHSCPDRTCPGPQSEGGGGFFIPNRFVPLDEDFLPLPSLPKASSNLSPLLGPFPYFGNSCFVAAALCFWHICRLCESETDIHL